MFTEFNIYIQLICITVFWVNVQNFNFFLRHSVSFQGQKAVFILDFEIKMLTHFIFLF